MKPPKKWKMAVVIWLAIYPLITTVFMLFGKELMLIESIPLRTLFLTLIIVPTMIFILVPAITKLLAGWLKND